MNVVLFYLGTLLFSFFSLAQITSEPSACKGTGAGLSLATAGTSASFTITARDAIGNRRTSGGDTFLIALDGSVDLATYASTSVLDQLTGMYSHTIFSVSYAVTRSGSYAMTVTLARGGGLSADYFENVWFFYTPVLSRIDAQVDFDWGTGTITPTAADYVSVRWSGRLLPRYSEVYTFYVDADDGVRLWINDVQLIDRWDTGANMTAAKSSLKANIFYRIKLEYKDNSGPAKISLFWASSSIVKEIVPASQLYYETSILGSPFAVQVNPAETCAATSLAFGPGLSCATAGAISAFTMVTRDAYENSRTAGGDSIVAHVYPSITSSVAAHAAITDIRDSTYHAMFTPVVSGLGRVGVEVLTLGGLFATMYTDVSFTTQVATVAVTGVQYAVASTPYIGSADPSNDALFSIRYSGFFKPTVTGSHTLQVDVANQVGENYLFFFDNKLAIDASVGSISASKSYVIQLYSTEFYNVRLEYISSSGSGSRALTLSSKTGAASMSTIASSNLYKGNHFFGSPFGFSLSASRLCASLCVVTDGSGDALSIATAGLSAMFTITTKDLYSNIRITGGNPNEFRVSLSGVAGASGSVVDNQDGTFQVVYVVTKSGTYDLSVVYGYAHIGSSPYRIFAQPSGRHMQSSIATGIGLTLLTAGVQATVTITVRDRFFNWQPSSAINSKITLKLVDGTTLTTVSFSSPAFASGTSAAVPVTLDNPRYVISFRVTKAGSYSLAIYGTDPFDTHVNGSPFKVTVRASTLADASVVHSYTLHTVGVPSYLNLQTFDSFGNVCDDCTTGLSVYTRLAGSVDNVGEANLVAPSKYNATFYATKCQSNSIHIIFGTGSGIIATYYPATNFGWGAGSKNQVLANLDFSVAANTPYQGFSSAFSARYVGLFRPTVTGIPTFKISHKSLSDCYRLTIANKVIATMSLGSAVATLSYTAPRMVANQLYDIYFEYIADQYGSGQPHGISFSVNWGSSDVTVGSAFMVAYPDRFFIQVPTFSTASLLYVPGTVCAGLLTRQSSSFALSIATAGLLRSFTIQSKDVFNNFRTVNIDDGISYALLSGGYVPPNSATSSSLNIQATAGFDNGREIAGSVRSLLNGGYAVSYLATVFGNYQLSGRVHRPGGLYGLYFETDSLQDHSLTPSMAIAIQPTFQRIDSVINFRWGLSKPMDTTDPYYAPFSSKSIGPDYFSVRWFGSVLAPLSEVFTFSVEVDDGVRLYIDNLLIINQWDFKSGIVDGTIALLSGSMYPIKLEYKESQHNATIVLMWSSRTLNQTIIPSSNLYYTVTSGPISSQVVYVPPSDACHSLSTIFGPGLTIATCGVPAYFTIQSMDEYGNHRLLMDSPYFYVRIVPVTASSIRPYKAQYNGLSSSSGLTSSIERISNPILIGGFTATYYTSSFVNGAAVSCQHLAWIPSNGCGGVDLETFVSGSGSWNIIGLLNSVAGSANSLVVRWAGFFQPTTSGQYRFFVGKGTGTAGFSISNVGGGLIPLASFNGVTTANPSASVILVANSFYAVSVQYASTGGSLQCKLQYTIEDTGSTTSYSSTFALVPTTNMFPLANRYRVMYNVGVTGDYSPEVSLAVPGGLDATFYDDMSFGTPRSTVFHTLVDFTSTSFASDVQRVSSSGLVDVGYGLGVNISDFNSFSVRWQGFFKATQSETTFSISIREADERVRLWVDNLLLINSWEYALSAVSFSATFGASFVENGGVRLSDLNSLFDVKIEYVQFAGQSGIRVPLFTAANVFAARSITIPPPFSAYPAATCAAVSRIRGSALTRATAGVPASFTIMSLDMYRNDRNVDGDLYVSRLYPVVCEFVSACPNIYATVRSLGDSSYVVSYVGTKKGSYDLVTSLAIPSFLSATYYGTPSFEPPRINVFKSYSNLVTMPSSSGGVRYAGFIRPPTTGPVTFSVGTSSLTTISLWVFDTRFGTTALNVYAGSSSGSTVMNFPTANAFYDIRVDLSSSFTSISLSWEYSGFVAAAIPADRVFARTDVPDDAYGVTSGPFITGVPINLMIVANGTCASQSISNGLGLTVATASAAASFRITARDAFNNDRGLAEDTWAISFTGPTRRIGSAFGDTRPFGNYAPPLNSASYSNVVGAGRYSASYSLTVSGLYSVSIIDVSSGGLNAQYYCNSWLNGQPCVSTIDSDVDFNWGLGVITSPSSSPSPLYNSDYMSIRWSGYFLLESADTVTFYTQTDEGLRLYVDDILLIDKWQSIGANWSATWSGLQSGGLYSIVLEYRETTNQSYCRLMYSTSLVAMQTIPSMLLFHSGQHIFGSPFSLYVVPTATCASLSQVSFSPVSSILTVGAATSMSISAFDQFGNARTSWDLSSSSIFVRTCALDFSDYCKRASVTKSSQGSWSSKFSATRAAPSNVLASIVYTNDANLRGMHATYYGTTTIGVGILKRAAFPTVGAILSSNTMADTWGTSANPLPFSIRWTGVFVASVRGQYTFSVTIASNDGARLYISNVMIIDAWATSVSSRSLVGTLLLDAGVNAFYDIVLDYRRVVNDPGSVSAFQYSCCSSGASVTFSTSVMQSFMIPPLPAEVIYSAGPAVLHKSTFNGIGLTISTSGILARFSVTSKDLYGNVLSQGGDLWFAYVSKADGNSVNASVVDGGNGVYYVAYTPVLQGAYVVSVVLGSAVRTVAMTVFPGLVCAANTLVSSTHFSISTAGYFSSFTVSMRDLFKNYRTLFTDNVVAKMRNGYDLKNLETKLFKNEFASPFAPTYVASYRTSLSGTYQIEVCVGTSFGLNASYYIDPNLSQLAVSRIDESIQFNWGVGSPHASIGIVDLFSVQWSGYVKPDHAGVYTFQVDIAGTDDRVRLWVDDQYILNSWGTTAPAGISLQSTIKLSSNTLYDIKLDYKDTTTNAAISLQWIRNNLSIQAIPVDRLIGYTEQVLGSPFTATFFPAQTCGSLSSATGHGLSIATAGIPASFTITAVDHLGNQVTTSSDLFTVRARYAAADNRYDEVGTVNALGNGLYHGFYIPVLKRNNRTVTSNKQWHDVIVSHAVPGALLATYYLASSPLVPVVTATTALTSSSTPAGVGGTYNARFLGLIRPPSETWTFSVSSVVGTISVRINGKQVLTGAASATFSGAANALYDVDISITGAPSGSPVLSLNLEGTAKSLLVESARVFQRHDLSFQIFDSAGLLATFYNTGAFGSPTTQALVPNIDWSYAAGSSKYHSSAASTGSYGVRWAGFVRPTMRDVYTFFFQKSLGETVMAFSIDNRTPIQISDSATEFSVTYFILANQLYELNVELMSSNSATAMFRVLWKNDGNAYVNYNRPADGLAIPKMVIGNDSFFRIRTKNRIMRDDQHRFFDTDASWPSCGSTSAGNALRWIQCRGQGERVNDVLSVEVKHALICASTSTVTIVNAVTSITAGVTGTFDIVVRDQFSNILDTDSDAILVRISLESGLESPFYGSVASTSTGTSAGDPRGRYSVSYVVTKSGTFSLVIAAVGSANGLRGSFFNNPFFTDPLATLTSSTIDFNWGMGLPVSQLRSSSGWSARWTGFLRLVDTASSMYSFFLGTGHGGGRLFVGNKLVVDSTSVANDYKLGSEFSGTVSLTSNVVYDVTVEYVALSAPAYLSLSYASYSQTKTIVPSSALFPFSSVFSNGAQTLSVVDFRRNCAASSQFNGPGLTVATAGVIARFTITSIDQYGNRRSSQSVNPDCSTEANCVFATAVVPDDASSTIRPFRGQTSLQATNELFAVEYTVTRSAGYSVTTSALTSSSLGLWATYYDDVGWIGPRLSIQLSDPTWTITTADIPTPAIGALSKDTLWSVRYRGSYKPTTPGAHTFAFSVTEKLRAFVDGALLADTYTTPYSGVATSVSGTINLPNSNTLYEIHLMYESDSTTGSTFGATINTASYSSLVPANLFSSAILAGAPSRSLVLPNLPCGTTSSMRGAALTLATAGVIARFTVTLRDAYGNLRNAADGFVVASAFALTGSYITPSFNMYQGNSHTAGNTCTSCPIAPVAGVVSPGSSSELHNVQITITKAGNYKVTAAIARPGGLSATYYVYDSSYFNFNGAVSARAMFGSLDYTTPAAVSARWQGYIRPSRAGSYTFSVEPYSSSASDGHFRMWISQTLVIDRGASGVIPAAGFSAVFSFPYANNMYDLFVAYHSPSAPTASSPAGFRLYWQSAQVPGKIIAGDTQKEKIPTSNLYIRDEIAGLNHYVDTSVKVTVHADVGSARTYATGNQLTLTTAGTAGSFTITSRDTFDNSRTLNDLSVSAAVFSSDGFPKSATLTFIDCSTVCKNRVSYTATTFTRAGSYSIVVYDRAFVVNRFPQTLIVQPGDLCGSTSYAFGSGISSAMVGYASLFTIQAMDSFGNARTTSNNIATDIFAIRIGRNRNGDADFETFLDPSYQTSSDSLINDFNIAAITHTAAGKYPGTYTIGVAPAAPFAYYFRSYLVFTGFSGRVTATYYRIPGSIPATGLDFDNPRCVIQTTKSELILKINCVCVECADSCNSQSIACFTNSALSTAPTVANSGTCSTTYPFGDHCCQMMAYESVNVSRQLLC